MSDLFLVTVKKSYSKFLLLRKEKPVDLAKGWRIGDRIEAFGDFLDLGSYLANSLLVFETQIHAKDKVGRYSDSCFFATFETRTWIKSGLKGCHWAVTSPNLSGALLVCSLWALAMYRVVDFYQSSLSPQFLSSLLSGFSDTILNELYRAF